MFVQRINKDFEGLKEKPLIIKDYYLPENFTLGCIRPIVERNFDVADSQNEEFKNALNNQICDEILKVVTKSFVNMRNNLVHGNKTTVSQSEADKLRAMILGDQQKKGLIELILNLL